MRESRLAISHISRLFPTAPLLSAAFSIGANVLVHYLAEEADARSAVTASSSSSSSNRTSSVLKDGVRSSSDGVGSTSGASRAGPLVAASAREKDKVSPRPQLTAAVSLCNPFNLTLGDWNWRRPDAGFRRAYDRYLAARMSDVFSQNWEVLAAGAASQPPPTPGSRRVPDQNADVGSLESSSVYPVASSSSSSESDGTAGLQEGALLGGTTRRPSMGAAHSGRSSSIMQKGNYSQQRVPNDGRPDMPITAEDQAALAAASGVHVASNSSSSSSSSSSSNSGGSSALDSSGDRLAAGHEHAVPLSGDSGRNSGTSSSSSSSSSSNTSTESVRGQSSSSPALYCSSLSFHARDSRNWPIRIPKPLVTVRPATIRPEDARRAPTVRDFDDAATRHWFGFYSVDEYYAAASSAYHLDAVDIPLLCISAEDDPICPKEAIPIEAFDKNPHLMLIITPTGGHLGWIDLNPGGGGWRGRPWTEDVMLEYLQAVLAQERNARNNV
ncbi:hypothetical protein DUNSADRAFT_6904 [Dunaliella salina]|uniref:Uncharacterized protein n=1 Tax=Dunaliella salina TaxID=3046 RepID=A0ABQ7GMD1_DUNSA|nr:hypothetical protein DUNSADRAFT_6904 [Dunaliella salina]|eukprot:KAF5835764.1 hypothetical protein DUNSADRAFT_6904 [Dunaliella salina]